MRILTIHPRMSVFGGGERVAVHSIITALKTGHEVALACETFDVSAFEDFFACPGLFKDVQMLTYPTFRPLAGRAVLYQRLVYHQWYLRSVTHTAGDFDLILSTQDAVFLPSPKVPVIQYCYFPEYFVHLESSPSSLFWKTYYWPAVLFYHNRVGHIDTLLSTSNYTRTFVKEKWGRDSLTLYPPCPIDMYSNLNGRKEDLVITVGRLVPEKRIDLFLDIARKLPEVKFVVIGSLAPGLEKYYQHLRQSSPTNVSLMLSPLRRLKDLLSRAKIYVHCARSEHFGITIVEAMAAGCVPVVYDSGGPREIVTTDVGYRWKTVDEAARQISLLVRNDALREERSILAISSSEKFGPEAFESGLETVLTRYNTALQTSS